MTKKNNRTIESDPHICAYRIMVMLGDIVNEIQSGGKTCGIEELLELYEYSSTIYGYFQNETEY